MIFFLVYFYHLYYFPRISNQHPWIGKSVNSVNPFSDSVKETNIGPFQPAIKLGLRTGQGQPADS